MTLVLLFLLDLIWRTPYLNIYLSGSDFSVKVAQETGIMTDPVYTGKALYGLVQELNNNPSRFKGRRILFLHTGKWYKDENS